MKIKLMNKIAKVGTDVFGAGYTVSDAVEAPDAIMVRSAKLHEMPIEYIDERRSSILASDYMTETGTFGKKRKESVDTLSAQIILQTYLDRIRK